ncbi:pentapeptide repeat-containing protein [Ferruginibacter yonginensis]|uniref:Pentapeptide repeat-containing protein n=1 Tax=Ferruginibacter yonginensis TaxID=1310416 RepID=A0ABV8QPL8_9BACT
MNHIIIEDEQFESIDFTVTPFQVTTYENCQFVHCNFMGVDVQYTKWVDCTFTHCNFSMSNIANSFLVNAHFIDCKLLGLRFDYCNPFNLSFRFQHCNLSQSTFFKVKMKLTEFTNCILHEVDFTEADLTKASFHDTDLAGAVFDQTRLNAANFSTAINFNINPLHNSIKKAVFTMPSVVGLLNHFDIVVK